jgi:hypothetical protein
MAITIPIITDFNARGLKDAETKIDKFAKSAGRGLKNLGKAAAIGAAAFGAGIAVFGKKAIEAGEAAATSNARIAQINESMGLFGDSTKQVTDRLIKYAQATARSTGVDQNQIKLTQAKLLTFNKLARSAGKLGGSFDRATKAAVDMASAGFGSAENNAVQLGKALNDPIKGVTALTKSGITFTAQEKEKIKTLVESNRMLEAQELVLKAIETQVGGTAEATANDTDKMKVAFSQVSERVGIALLPILSKLTSFLIDTLIPAAEKVVKIFNKEGLGGVLRRLGDFIQDAIPPALTALGNFLQAVGSWIVNTGAPLLVEKIGVLKDRLTSWIKESGPQALSNLGAFMGDMIKWIINDGIPLLSKRPPNFLSPCSNGSWTLAHRSSKASPHSLGNSLSALSSRSCKHCQHSGLVASPSEKPSQTALSTLLTSRSLDGSTVSSSSRSARSLSTHQTSRTFRV